MSLPRYFSKLFGLAKSRSNPSRWKKSPKESDPAVRHRPNIFRGAVRNRIRVLSQDRSLPLTPFFPSPQIGIRHDTSTVHGALPKWTPLVCHAGATIMYFLQICQLPTSESPRIAGTPTSVWEESKPPGPHSRTLPRTGFCMRRIRAFRLSACQLVPSRRKESNSPPSERCLSSKYQPMLPPLVWTISFPAISQAPFLLTIRTHRALSSKKFSFLEINDQHSRCVPFLLCRT